MSAARAPVFEAPYELEVLRQFGAGLDIPAIVEVTGVDRERVSRVVAETANYNRPYARTLVIRHDQAHPRPAPSKPQPPLAPAKRAPRTTQTRKVRDASEAPPPGAAPAPAPASPVSAPVVPVDVVPAPPVLPALPADLTRPAVEAPEVLASWDAWYCERCGGRYASRFAEHGAPKPCRGQLIAVTVTITRRAGG